MFVLEGKHTNAYIYANEVEPTALIQIQNVIDCFVFDKCHIAIMPDCHSGSGCVIGFTSTYNGKIVPNLVGVDISCLDKDTEVLTRGGWIKISNYNNEEILTYNKHTDMAKFEQPLAYIVDSCEEFFEIKHGKGMDLLISNEHKMLVWQGFKGRGYNIKEYKAIDFVNKHNSLVKGVSGGIKACFNLEGPSDYNYTDDQIRLAIAISADARIRENKRGDVGIEFHFKKERKIQRTKQILEKCNIIYRQYIHRDMSTTIFFNAKKNEYTKDLNFIYKLNANQLKIASSESLLWDGHTGYRSYYSTTIKENADAIQYAFAASNIRASIYCHKLKIDKHKDAYYVIPTRNKIVGFRPDKINKVSSSDGKKYCFTTSTGYFVIRRNNNILITGNCGMESITFSCDKELNLVDIDTYIRTNIPSGFDGNKYVVCSNEKLINSVWRISKDVLNDVEVMDGHLRKIGSLGGGNHFIEISKYISDENKYCITVHSGSRNFGLKIANHFQKIAIEKCKLYGIPKELSFLEGKDAEAYFDAVSVANDYAIESRISMLYRIMKFIRQDVKINILDTNRTIHNYIDFNSSRLPIIRKGAVLANSCFVVPINMMDGTLICKGKLNINTNSSGPHGAGRLMSRTKAKSIINCEKVMSEMKSAGVYTTSINNSTIDEAPEAYKNIEDIKTSLKEMDIEVIDQLKPIYNFKAS